MVRVAAAVVVWSLIGRVLLYSACRAAWKYVQTSKTTLARLADVSNSTCQRSSKTISTLGVIRRALQTSQQASLTRNHVQASMKPHPGIGAERGLGPRATTAALQPPAVQPSLSNSPTRAHPRNAHQPSAHPRTRPPHITHRTIKSHPRIGIHQATPSRNRGLRN